MILFISGSVNEALGLGTPLTHMPCIYWETAQHGVGINDKGNL